MTINEIYSNKVASDVAANKSVTDIIASTKRLIQMMFCSINNKNQISEKAMSKACTQLDNWSKLPAEVALSEIKMKIKTSTNSLAKNKAKAKERNKEEARRQDYDYTLSAVNY